MKIELEEILRLPKNFWEKVGNLIQGWVKDDALIGIMQDNKKGLHYKSKDYIKYKANQMKGFRTGKRLKTYATTPIESTNTSFVDMTLSGRTINSLHPKSFDESGVLMAFAPDKTKIVLGNYNRGYNIIGLNDKNRTKILDLMLRKLDENKKKLLKDKIVINIGR